MSSTLRPRILSLMLSDLGGQVFGLATPHIMLAFMWQDDLIGVAKFVNACLHKMNPSEGQTSDQPGVAGRDVM